MTLTCLTRAEGLKLNFATMRNHKGWPGIFLGRIFLLLALYCVYFLVFPVISDAAEPAESGIPDPTAKRSSVGHEEGTWPAMKDMEEGAFLLERDVQEVHKGRNNKKVAVPSSALSNVVTVALATALFTVLAVVARDVMNFVGDVPDPFENVLAAKDIPAAVKRLIESDAPVAFVVRRCKFCGLGIKAMKKAGLQPVVVMVEGHRFRKEISAYLKSSYGVQGFPYFFVNRKNHGYLSRLKEYLQ